MNCYKEINGQRMETLEIIKNYILNSSAIDLWFIR